MSASVHAGMPYPPPDGEPPRMENPPQWRTPPRDVETPPPPLPPGKQTPAYGLREAGTHPTGMHTCLDIEFNFKMTTNI